MVKGQVLLYDRMNDDLGEKSKENIRLQVKYKP